MGVDFLSCRYHPYDWLTVNGAFHSIYCSHQLKEVAMTTKCEEKGCRETATYKIGKRQFLHGRPLEKRRWISVCPRHEKVIGDANEEE